jgi:ATP-binding cassette subfamily B protein
MARLTPAALGRFQIVTLIPQVHLPLAVCLAVLVVVSAVLPVAFTLASGQLIGAIPGAMSGGFESPAGQLALHALTLAGAAFVGQRIAGPVRGVVAEFLGQELERHLEARVMRAVNRPPGIEHLEDPAVLDCITSAREPGAGGWRPGEALVALATVLPRWLQSVSFAILLATFSWVVGAGLFAAYAYVSHVHRREYLRTTRAVSGQTASVRRAAYFRDLALDPAAAKEVRIYGLGGWLADRFSSEWLRAMTPVWQERRLWGTAPCYATGFLAVAHGLAFGYLGWSGVLGALDLTSLAIFVGALGGIGSVMNVSSDDIRLEWGTAAVPAVLELERLVAAGASPPAGAGNGVVGPSLPSSGGPRTPERGLRQGIRCEAVTFRYPSAPAEVLTGLDLDIPAGKSLAIVGANGAGKTTLAKLLCRFYQPQSGRITVDGVDLRAMEARTWQRQVAAIFQDFAQYQLSVRENIGFGAPALAGDHRRLVEAARRAGALELIESLPAQWDTVLSRQFKGGAELSAGQWQRIALARALFAVEAGATVLILDEPSAGLDVRAEAELYEHFLELTAGLTTILISHRFATVRRVDRICVLQHGRVVEQGTHDQLVARGGRYAEMFTLQASRFSVSP